MIWSSYITHLNFLYLFYKYIGKSCIKFGRFLFTPFHYIECPNSNDFYCELDGLLLSKLLYASKLTSKALKDLFLQNFNAFFLNRKTNTSFKKQLLHYCYSFRRITFLYLECEYIIVNSLSLRSTCKEGWCCSKAEFDHIIKQEFI